MPRKIQPVTRPLSLPTASSSQLAPVERAHPLRLPVVGLCAWGALGVDESGTSVYNRLHIAVVAVPHRGMVFHALVSVLDLSLKLIGYVS